MTSIKINKTKPLNMKQANNFIKWSIMILLSISATKTFAQAPYSNTGNQTVCLNSTEPYGVPLTVGSTYQWTVTPISGGNGTITIGATSNLITVNWTSPGTVKLEVIETNAQGCTGNPVSIIVTVNPLPSEPTVVTPVAYCLNGTAAALVATGTGSLLWYSSSTGGPGSTTAPVPSTAATGNTSYWVSQTDAAGCESERAEIVVTVNPSLTPAISGLDVVCESMNGSTETYATPNVPGGTYNWVVVGGTFTGQATDQIVVTWTTPGAGSIQLNETISSTGCNGNTVKTITITPKPNTSPITHN
jgi:hypothetical protein